MKKLLFSFLMLTSSILMFAQQMNVSVSGNTVTFTCRVDGSGGTDWTSSPVNLYAYTDVADTTPNGSSSTNVLGGWPGTAMVDDGNGNFSVSVDLATIFSTGTTVNNINFIYNTSNGTGGYYQNPTSGGFATIDGAHATGWSPVTISTLGVSDLVSAKNKSFVAGGKLYTKQAGNLDITVYDMSGKVVNKSQVKSSDSSIDLNVKQRGTYMVKISNGSQTEVVKFIK